MEDKDIVDLIYNREEIGLTELKKKYHSLLWSLSKSILKNDWDSEECIQDTYLKIWSKIPPYHPIYLKSFISKIIRQISIDKYRSNATKRNNEMVFEEFECIISDNNKTDNTFGVTELTRLVNKFLKELEITTQVLFIRRYFNGESVKDLANRFKLSENVISVKLNRTKKKLKAFLEKEGYYIEKN